MATIRAGKFVSDKDLATSTQVAIVLYGQLNIINRFMLFRVFFSFFFQSTSYRSKSRSVDHGLAAPFDLDSLRSKVEQRFESVDKLSSKYFRYLLFSITNLQNHCLCSGVIKGANKFFLEKLGLCPNR